MKKNTVLSMLAAAGLAVGCSSMDHHRDASAAMTLDQLPQAAQQTVRNEVGDTQIYSIKQCDKNGQTAYKVEVQRNGFALMKPTLVVSQDGSIIKESRDLADRRTKVNEAAGAQNTPAWDQNGAANSGNSQSASPGSTQAPSEANPAGSNPNQALPSTSGSSSSRPQ